ncbi:MAG TPA: sulfurtransferase TusA family protein [Syntrophorhabdaceae bacterium]|nr:sulfurtransferase TusA family protein [Syntrophorhabdaceae bacterium]
MEIVDARGYSCPQPVIMTMSVINKIAKGNITILVDTDTSKENVIRAAISKGWNLDSIKEDEGHYQVVISRA